MRLDGYVTALIHKDEGSRNALLAEISDHLRNLGSATTSG
jgi:hypothetical protein